MSSIDSIYWILLSTGFLVGFGHCIGMCGPIVVSLSLNLKGQRTWVPHLFYNAGRVVTYSVLGGIMGLSGSFTIVVSNISAIQKGVMIFAGLIIILMGLAMSGFIPLGRIFGDYYNPQGLITRGFQKLTASESMISYFPLGLLLGLLPCGPVYTALIASARNGMEAGSPIEAFGVGMGIMLAFGLGTIPALLLVGRLSNLKWLKSREIIYKFGSILMIIVGVYFVIQGIRY